MSKRPANKTGAVSLLLLFYFFFFCSFLRTSMSPSRDRVDFIWYARAVFFFFNTTFSFFLDILMIFYPCWASCFPFTAGLHPSRRTNSRLFQRVREKKRERDGQTCERKKKKKKGTTRYIHTTQEENSGQQPHPTWRERETDALLLKRHSVAT